ncbi:MAG: hypothetical protein KDB03_11560 [Planctomycetales bacterium]|nr:hypothetical protein [Planctomycetales bacterium]
MNSDATNTPEESLVEAESPLIDPAKAEALFAQLVKQQNLPLGLLAGFVAAVLGGLAWAAVTIVSGYQIGWMAVGIGFLVGFAVRLAGKGLTKSFGFGGGLLALLGCLLGNLLAVCGMLAQELQQPVLSTTLQIVLNPPAAIELMKMTFSPMDLLFYGIAVFEGFKFSFRQIDDSELNAMLG